MTLCCALFSWNKNCNSWNKAWFYQMMLSWSIALVYLWYTSNLLPPDALFWSSGGFCLPVYHLRWLTSRILVHQKFFWHLEKKKTELWHDTTKSNVVVTLMTTTTLVLRDLDKISNNEVCLVLFEITQINQAHLLDRSTTAVSFFLSLLFLLKTNISFTIVS